jgi:multidrug efflux system membrane fusion protein
MTEHTPAPAEVGRPRPAAPNASPESPRSSPPGRGRWIWLLVLALVAGAAYYVWARASGAGGATPPNAPAGKTDGGGRGGHGGRGGAIPVVAVKAVRGNIGEYVTGMGNVTPLYTVTVKTRVDGELMEIHYKEGDIVQKGAPLVEVDPRPYQVQLEQAEGALARDQALLDNARVDLQRYEGLLKQNAIPEQQYATQKALVAQEEGVVKADQGQIDSAKLNLIYCHITAPITGRVGLRLVDPGNIVHAADATGLMVITQIEPISVIFPIAEDELPKVMPRFRAGQTLAVDAWNRDQSRRLGAGTLVTVDNQIDPTTGTVRLRADFPNKDDALFPNQLAWARLLVQEKRGVTLIPTAAVQLTTTNQYVYLVKPDSTVTVRDIQTGTAEGDETQVTSGLQPGDEIVLTGVDKLNEGTKVTAQLQQWTQHSGPVGTLGGFTSGSTPPAGSQGVTQGATPGALPKTNQGRPVRQGGRKQ